jgi:hypothetical protein
LSDSQKRPRSTMSQDLVKGWRVKDERGRRLADEQNILVDLIYTRKFR